MEVVHLRDLLLQWRNLVGIALMDLTNNTTMPLNDNLHIRSLLAWRQIEHHRDFANDWLLLCENGSSFHLSLVLELAYLSDVRALFKLNKSVYK